MVVDPQTCRFWQAALQSGAIDAAGLLSCWESIPEAKRVPDAIDRRLARQAVTSQRLTLWQAQQILAGRGFALKIDKYLLIDLIGQGGMGRVYLARDTRLHRKVALKILSRERMSNPRALARFEREAKVGAQLQHDNLVRIYDEGDAHGLRYLVMEYIDGRNAAQLLADLGRFPPAAAAMIGRQIALGLEHARLKGLIHRDVNPQNIVITRDGTAKLTDLGLAIDLNDPDDIVTRDGATVGTFDYISPEQARHPRDVDTRSDIYSLGCSLYHMIAGRVPFPTTSLPEKLYAHQLTKPDPLSTLVRDVPPGLDALVLSMMAKAQADRPATPLEAAQALEAFIPPDTSLSVLLDEAARRAANPEEPATPQHPALVAGPGSNGAAGPHDPTASVKAVGTDPDMQLGDMTANPPATDLPQASSQAGFSLPIDLGPELPLSDSLVVNRMRSRSRSSTSGDGPTITPSTHPAGPDSSHPWPRRLLLPVGVLAALAGLLIALGLLARGFFPQPGPNGSSSEVIVLDPGPPPLLAADESPDNTQPGVLSPTAPPPSSSGFFVLMKNSQEMIELPTLQEALNLASGGRGEILIGDVKDEIKVADVTTLVPPGAVVLRPKPGSKPVLTIRIQGRQPWLRHSEGRLSLVGLTFLVHVDAPREPNNQPSSLIESNDALRVENCTFVDASSRGRQSCAIRHRGNSSELLGDFFLGFDYPLILDAYQGSSSLVRNCLMVWPEGKPDIQPGWAIRLTPRTRARPGHASLTIEDCTVLRAAGLIETISLDPENPVKVKLLRSAIRSDHLLAWSPGSSGDPPITGLEWSADGNRYDLQKPAWLVEDHDGLIVPDHGPSDLPSWRELVGDREGPDSSQAIVRLENEAALRSGSIDATRYRLAKEEAGADLSKVGPIDSPPSPTGPN